MASSLNHLIVEDDDYTLTAAYRKGAEAFRNSVPFTANPFHPHTQAHYDWENGHTNESAGFHVWEGLDVLALPRNGQRIHTSISSLATASARVSASKPAIANVPRP